MVSYIRCCQRAHTTGKKKCCPNCKCPERLAINAAYMVEYRARVKAKKAAMGKLSAVPDIDRLKPATKSISVETQYPSGVIGKNALAEIAKIDGANERNPLLVAMIMRLAHEIDRGEAANLASAANTIKRLMDDLRSQCPAVEQSGPAGVVESPRDRFMADWERAGS